eukprot:349803-Chlamydomonas_euryale.AAC.2
MRVGGSLGRVKEEGEAGVARRYDAEGQVACWDATQRDTSHAGCDAEGRSQGAARWKFFGLLPYCFVQMRQRHSQPGCAPPPNSTPFRRARILAHGVWALPAPQSSVPHSTSPPSSADTLPPNRLNLLAAQLPPPHVSIL